MHLLDPLTLLLYPQVQFYILYSLSVCLNKCVKIYFLTQFIINVGHKSDIAAIQ